MNYATPQNIMQDITFAYWQAAQCLRFAILEMLAPRQTEAARRLDVQRQLDDADFWFRAATR